MTLNNEDVIVWFIVWPFDKQKSKKQIHRIKTISESHRFRRLPRRGHPLISVINYESIKNSPGQKSASLVLDYYSISLKRNIGGKIKYGQQEYDFDEGTMFFISPGQFLALNPAKKKPRNDRVGCCLSILIFFGIRH